MTRVAYPRLSHADLGLFRLVGPGLGNLLFPWARAVVAARRLGMPIIWPTWPQLKLGPLLRFERDTRFYFDLFERPPGYVGGLARLAMLALWERTSEEALDGVDGAGDKLIMFEGMDGHFATVLSEHRLVRQELLRMSRPEHTAVPAEVDRAIVVHVRLGDFSAAPDASALIEGHHNYRIPVSWYADQVRKVALFLPDAPVFVFSDGRDQELGSLLQLPRACRAPNRSSLGDMLSLSRGRVLIASGSTFSMWASFLGRMPVIWFPGQLRQRLYVDARTSEVELAEHEPIPEDFARAVLAG